MNDCSTCMYFKAATANGGVCGVCRRHPPTARGGDHAMFPIVYSTTWCGEHATPHVPATIDELEADHLVQEQGE